MRCEFPARQLLVMRRQIARQADTREDGAFVSQAMRFVKEVDELRLTHYDLTGCSCWQDAIRIEGVDPAVAKAMREWR